MKYSVYLRRLSDFRVLRSEGLFSCIGPVKRKIRRMSVYLKNSLKIVKILQKQRIYCQRIDSDCGIRYDEEKMISLTLNKYRRNSGNENRKPADACGYAGS